MANKENRAAKVKAREKANKAKKAAESNTLKVFTSKDEGSIIQRLKKLGMWEEFKARIDAKPGHNIELTLNNSCFFYICSEEFEEPGFVFFECKNEKDFKIIKKTWDDLLKDPRRYK